MYTNKRELPYYQRSYTDIGPDTPCIRENMSELLMRRSEIDTLCMCFNTEKKL